MPRALYLPAVLFTLALAAGSAFADDTAMGLLMKHADYTQTSSGPATLVASSPYGFEVDLVESSTAPDTITGGSFTGPTLPVTLLNFKPANLDWLYKDNIFSSASQVDAVFPSGAYPLTINALHDGSPIIPLSLATDDFPAAPHITDFDALQSINAANPVSVSWDPMSNGTATDFELFQLVNSSGITIFQSGYPGAPDALNGLATGLNIPAGTLQPGSPYEFRFLFGKVQSSNSTFTTVPILSLDAAESFLVVQTLPAPEPSSLCLLTLAASALLLRRPRCLRTPAPSTRERQSPDWH